MIVQCNMFNKITVFLYFIKYFILSLQFIADEKLSAEDPSLVPIVLPVSVKTEIKKETEAKTSVVKGM